MNTFSTRVQHILSNATRRIAVFTIPLLLLMACNTPESEGIIPAPPTATATVPSATPTLEPTLTPEAQGVQLPNGACSHPYFPVVEDRTLVYRNNREGRETITEISFVDVNRSAFTIELQRDSDAAILIPWSCTSAGILSPVLIEDYTASLLFELDSPDVSGITLLSADQMVLGSTWSTEYMVHEMGGVESAAGILYTDYEVTLNHRVAAKEPISIALAEFPDSYRVDTEGQFRIALRLGDEVVEEEVAPVHYSSWYVEYVGLVRQDFRVGFFDGTDEMRSVTELVEIRDSN